MELNKIYLGDTLETLRKFPDNTFHIVVTSPPYNKGGAKGGLVKEVKYRNSSDTRDENAYQATQIDVLNELYRVMVPGGHLFYNHKPRLVKGATIHPLEWIFSSKFLGNLKQEIVWDRGIAAQLRGWQFWQIDERIYWLQKGITTGFELESRHALLKSIWKLPPEQGYEDHPAPFPVELPARCIYSIANEQNGLNVLDPYSGTGSTLVAAKAFKHNYVGIDCSSDYITIAEKRLAGMTEFQRVMDEAELHWVEKSYKQRKQRKHEISLSRVQRHD